METSAGETITMGMRPIWEEMRGQGLSSLRSFFSSPTWMAIRVSGPEGMEYRPEMAKEPVP